MPRSSTRTEPFAPLALWGGVECTVNRVGDRFFDQLAWNGHREPGRLDDLDRIAELGIRTLRYPVLWESVAPAGLESADWAWTDERLARLRALGIRPVVTLVHHGSGPASTDLLDPGFAPGLASFARAVAERYPWVEDYTPVNEPFTTARFSALYGHWYPHHRDMGSAVRALLHETAGTVAAMRAIRAVTPRARLVQTEDIGKTHATPALGYQAAFENERRWLSLDLLHGRVDAHHPLAGLLRWLGIGEEELAPFRAEPCPPDLIGVNYYATSERFLDERLERYPAHTHGGNGRDAYADVEAYRVAEAEPAGFAGILRDVAARYPAPIAITEAHLGGTREEQLRWLRGAWAAAEEVRAEGIDVRAVTVWALLGSHNWHSLVTRDDGHYEAGAFDVSSGRPRLTALGELASALAHGRDWSHPALDAPGWWQRDDRLLYGTPPDWRPERPTPATERRIVLVGPYQAVRPLADACDRRHLAAWSWSAPPAATSGDERIWGVVAGLPRPSREDWARLAKLAESRSVLLVTSPAAVQGSPAAASLLARQAAVVLLHGEDDADAARFAQALEALADGLLDLAIDDARGVWLATEDELLVEAPDHAWARIAALAAVESGDAAANGAVPLDGSGAFR